MPRLRDAPDDLFALSGAAAETLGIPDPAFVEKDFWVVELLRSVVQPFSLEPVGTNPCSVNVMFKGGTSLSKAYGLISRFSEDVDILVAIEGYGAAARDNRVLRPICDRARTDLDLDEAAVTFLSHKTGTTRNVDYAYPSRIKSELIRTAVRLEMGTRGGVIPGTQARVVRSYIADYIAHAGIDAVYDELVPVEVDVIAPVRTLVEKLALLHNAGVQSLASNSRPLDDAGRHFYDVYQLLGDPGVRSALETSETSTEVIAMDVDTWSEKSGWTFTPRPPEGYASSSVFSREFAFRSAAESSYENGINLVWGQRPSFEDCLAAVRGAALLL